MAMVSRKEIRDALEAVWVERSLNAVMATPAQHIDALADAAYKVADRAAQNAYRDGRHEGRFG